MVPRTNAAPRVVGPIAAHVVMARVAVVRDRVAMDPQDLKVKPADRAMTVSHVSPEAPAPVAKAIAIATPADTGTTPTELRKTQMPRRKVRQRRDLNPVDPVNIRFKFAISHVPMPVDRRVVDPELRDVRGLSPRAPLPPSPPKVLVKRSVVF